MTENNGEDLNIAKVEAILDVATRQIKDKSISTSKFVGKWYPFYKKENPRGAIEGIAKDFSSLAGLSGKENPTFLDLGSGDGLMVDLADSTGKFARSIGVEMDTKVSARASALKDELSEQGVIDGDKVTLINGSYYSPRGWASIYGRWLSDNGFDKDDADSHLLFDTAAMLGLVTSVDDVVTLDTLKQFMQSRAPSRDVFADNGLRTPDGKIDADVVFWYPSDIFAHQSRTYWEENLKSGSLFVLTGNNMQVKEMVSSGFLQEGFDFEGTMSQGKLGNTGPEELYVYRKK